jgi:hypothetical protein
VFAINWMGSYDACYQATSKWASHFVLSGNNFHLCMLAHHGQQQRWKLGTGFSP